MERGRNRLGGTDDTVQCGAPPSKRHASHRSVRSPRSRRRSSLDNSGTRPAVSVRSPPDSRARRGPGRAACCLRRGRFDGRVHRESGDDGIDVHGDALEPGRVGVAASPNRDIVRRVRAPTKHRQQTKPHELPQPTLESVAFDRGVVMSWHDDPDARTRERGREHTYVEVRRADSPPLLHNSLNVEAPGEASLARKSEAPLPVRRRRTCSAT